LSGPGNPSFGLQFVKVRLGSLCGEASCALSASSGLGLTPILISLAVLAMVIGAAESFAQPSEPRLAQLKAIAEQVVSEKGASVCDARDLPGGAGRPPMIVASLDMSGRRFCNEIMLIRNGVPPTVVQSIQAWWANDLSTVVLDLRGTGDFELVVPQAISDYEGTRACIATFPVVYTCSASSCVDSSSQFVDFDAQELNELQRELATLQNSGPDQDTRRAPCATMEADKIRRLLGMDSRAGFETASLWMRSSDPTLREKAVAVFGDIGGAASRQGLQTLAADPDPAVALAARLHLGR
jgi:hypothetical protein